MVKLKILHYKITLFICILVSFGFSGQVKQSPTIEIGIIDFFYIYNGGYIPKNSFRKIIEKQVLIPSLKRELKEYNVSKTKVIFKKVSHGKLDNTNLAIDQQYSDNKIYKSYDILMWGQVLPLEWPNDYELDIFLFTNPDKYEETVFPFYLKISNGRIISWNQRPCDFPEETIGIVPGSICYKIANNKITHASKNSSKQINKNILQRLKSFGAAIPINYIKEIIEWYPDNKVSAPASGGSLELSFENKEHIHLNLSNSIYRTIESIILLNKASNWPLKKYSLMMPDINIKADDSIQDFNKTDFEDYFTDLKIEDKIVIGILPFYNSTKRKKYNWLGFGLEYLLNNKLSKVPVFNVVDNKMNEQIINKIGFNNNMDVAAMSEVAQLSRLDIAISGNYSLIGNKIVLDLIVVDGFTGAKLFSKQYLKKRNNLFNIANEIAYDLIQVTAIHLPDQREIIENDRITNSIKAFEYFCMGYIEEEKPKRNMNTIINNFKKATHEDPEFWEAYYNLGIAYFNNKEYTNAYNKFNKTILALPSFEKAYIGRALTFLHKKEYQKAEKDFKTAVNLNPYNYLSYYYLGKINVTLKQYTDANKVLSKAVKLNPDFGKTYFEIGNIYYAQNNLGLAIRNYEKATQLDPDNMEGHKILGDCYYRTSNYPGAYEEFKIVLQDNPNDADINFMMGITEYQQAVLEKYIADFLNNSQNTPRRSQENRPRTILGKKHHVYNKMVERFYKAQKLKKNFFEATFNLALTFQEMGDLDKAIIYYQKTIDINPNIIQAYLALIRIYEEKDEKEKALQKYKDVARIKPSLFATYPQLGEFYDNINIIDVIMKELEADLMNNPRNIETQLTLAKIFYAQGFVERASKIYKNILSTHPDNKKAKKMLSELGQR